MGSIFPRMQCRDSFLQKKGERSRSAFIFTRKSLVFPPANPAISLFIFKINARFGKKRSPERSQEWPGRFTSFNLLPIPHSQLSGLLGATRVIVRKAALNIKKTSGRAGKFCIRVKRLALAGFALHPKYLKQRGVHAMALLLHDTFGLLRIEGAGKFCLQFTHPSLGSLDFGLDFLEFFLPSSVMRQKMYQSRDSCYGHDEVNRQLECNFSRPILVGMRSRLATIPTRFPATGF